MGTPEVTQRIFATIRAIPRGTVAGYGHVARRAGLPGRARLVAHLLATCDEPGIPWHRVLRSDGRIAFPADSPQWIEQARRLRQEGVEVRGGRVRIAATDTTLDAELWGPGAG